MKILQVNLKCFNIEEMKGFYTDVLEMELISSTNTTYSVMAGSTILEFQKTDSIPFYHFCFRTNSEYFEEIFLKVDNEKRLLEDETRQKSMFWNGKQAYFTDPDGNILEMLERPFYDENKIPLGWYDVCEMGLSVFNVKETQQSLLTYIADEVNRENDTFAFYGDPNGYLVIVKEGRHWYPTNKGSTIHPLEVIVSGKDEAEFRFREYPYTFIVKNEKD